MKLQLFLAAAALLVCGITAELIVPPGPLPLCSYYKVVSAPTSLSETDIFPASGGNGFRPNLFLYNPGSLMSGNPRGPYFRFVDGSWTPGGALDFSLKLYEDAARTNWIGNATGHSNMFATNPDYSGLPDDYTISYVGGYVRIKTTMFPSYSQPSGASNKNFRNFDETLYFMPSDSMPGAFVKPLMNRLFNKTEINYFPDVTRRNNIFQPSTMAATDLYVILWGSNGWNGMEYSGYTTGADITFKLVCAPAPPTPNGGSTPDPDGPCPDGNCVNNFLANYPGCVSAPIVASNPTGNCVSLEFQAGTSNTPCPAAQ